MNSTKHMNRKMQRAQARAGEKRVKDLWGFVPGNEELVEIRQQIEAATGLKIADNGNMTRNVEVTKRLVSLSMQWLSGLFGPGDWIELTAISVDERVISCCAPLGDENLADFMAEHLFMRNIYFGVHPRKAGTQGRVDANGVACHHAIAVDLDHDPDKHGDFDAWRVEQAEALKRASFEHVVYSGGGVQGHGLVVRTSAREEMEARCKALLPVLKAVGSDPVGDLSRIMRLPFTVNIPKAKKRVRGRKLTLAVPAYPAPEPAPARGFKEVLNALASAFGVSADTSGALVPASSAKKDGPDLAPDTALVVEIFQRLENGTTFKNRETWVELALAAHGATGGDEDARAAFIEWSETYAGFTPGEAERVWNTAKPDGAGWHKLLTLVELQDPALVAEMRQRAAQGTFGDVSDAERSQMGEAAAHAATSAHRMKLTPGTVLAELKQRGAVFFHSDENRPYMRLDGRSYDLSSKVGKSTLHGLLENAGLRLSKNARADLFDRMEGLAHAGAVQELWTRVAVPGRDRIFIDMADDTGGVIAIDAHGWRVSHARDIPVVFSRSGAVSPLPAPQAEPFAKTLDTLLFPHFNLPPILKANDPDDEGVQARAGVILALSSYVRPVGAVPHVAFVGPNGSGKSTNADRLKGILDPSGHGRGLPPKDIRDLYVTARGQHVTILDNASRFGADLSDALCALSTGGGLSTRMLYSDGDTATLRVKRSIIFTSIGDILARGDLAERTAQVQLAPLKTRKTEAQLQEEWKRDHPAILHALCDTCVRALQILPAIPLHDLPRLADAAAFGEAMARGMGWKNNLFLEAVRTARADASASLAESDPMAERIGLILKDSGGRWTGTLTDFVAEVQKPFGGMRLDFHKGFSFSNRNVSGVLRRLMQPLRDAYGWEVSMHRKGDSSKKLLVELKGSN